MSYPRMDRNEYPPLPEVVANESDYELLIEYIVFSAIKIDELQKKAAYPLIEDEKRAELEKMIRLAIGKYDRLCSLVDDYRGRDKAK